MSFNTDKFIVLRLRKRQAKENYAQYLLNGEPPTRPRRYCR